MSDTPLLALPLVAAAQAQKHVTVNEALSILDALVQLAVTDRDLTSPPASPTEGQRFIVAASPTGAWAGHEGEVAVWRDGLWRFSIPRTGWLAYVVDEGALVAWSGTAWVDAISAITSLNEMVLLGLGTTADATNPFAAKLNKALWTARTAAEGGNGDLRYTLNKEAAGNILSLLFQTGFSARAEFGLTGDDDFRVKVSPDGLVWNEAIRVDRTTGVVSFPSGGGGGGGSSGHGQCRLTKSGSNLLLSPLNGNQIIIAGEARIIPAAGVTLAATGLTSGTLYYIYALMSGGTIVLEASTTGHATDAVTGVEIKSGDASRTLVGMARPIAGPAWQDSADERFVRSWFNDTGVSSSAVVSANMTSASTTFVELSTDIRLDVLLWAGESWSVDWVGAVTVTGSIGTVYTVANFDGVSAPDDPAVLVTPSTLGNWLPGSGGGMRSGFSEGFHYATLFGKVAAGTGAWRSVSGERFMLKGESKR